MMSKILRPRGYFKMVFNIEASAPTATTTYYEPSTINLI